MGVKIEFCCGGKKCPIVEQQNNEILIGGKKEGITRWDKDQFSDFVKAAKSGKFDNLLK